KKCKRKDEHRTAPTNTSRNSTGHIMSFFNCKAALQLERMLRPAPSFPLPAGTSVGRHIERDRAFGQAILLRIGRVALLRLRLGRAFPQILELTRCAVDPAQDIRRAGFAVAA